MTILNLLNVPGQQSFSKSARLENLERAGEAHRGYYLGTPRIGCEPAIGGSAVPYGGGSTRAIDGEVGRVVDREHHATVRPVHRPCMEPLQCKIEFSISGQDPSTGLTECGCRAHFHRVVQMPAAMSQLFVYLMYILSKESVT